MFAFANGAGHLALAGVRSPGRARRWRGRVLGEL